MILDLHTHHRAPYPEGIISVSPDALPDDVGRQLYSIGFHPWHLPLTGLTASDITMLAERAQRSDVVAIGECGIDLARAGAAPLAIQMIAFRKHVEISESVGKTLIIHCVKAHDIIISLKKELKPAQRWIIHGFRGKPSILKMLISAGIAVSYGEKFNPDSVAATPVESLFAGTDESTRSISDIIAGLQAVNPAVTPRLISSNIAAVLPLKDEAHTTAETGIL